MTVAITVTVEESPRDMAIHGVTNRDFWLKEATDDQRLVAWALDLAHQSLRIALSDYPDEFRAKQLRRAILDSPFAGLVADLSAAHLPSNWEGKLRDVAGVFSPFSGGIPVEEVVGALGLAGLRREVRDAVANTGWEP